MTKTIRTSSTVDAARGRWSGAGRRRSLRRVVGGVLAAIVMGTCVGAPAQAAGGTRLSMAITVTPANYGPAAAGQPVTLTFTVSNDTGAPLSAGSGSGVDVLLKVDGLGAPPNASGCSWSLWGVGAAGTDTFMSWTYALPAVVPTGPVSSCTLTYTPTANDVEAGGLWAMFTHEPQLDGAWDYGTWWVVGSEGHQVRPAVLGTPAVGRELTIDPGLWPFGWATGPTGGDYQWLRDGTEIAGATGATYTPVAADIGHAVSVGLHDPSTGISRVSDPVSVSKFVDVPVGYSFGSYITWLSGKGISNGWVYPDGSAEFRPTTPVSREAMAAFLYRDVAAPGYTPPGAAAFTDVPTSYPFYTNIAWLAQQGISTGYADGTFKPTDPVSREAMAAFLYRAAGSPAYTPPASPRFSDVPTDYPFYTQISWLAAQGISTGYADGTFKPTAPVTREAMAAFLQRADTIFHPAG